MLAYAFTPYVVQYAGLYSVFLGPWAALPWWIGFAVHGTRRRGWYYPAWFAITVQLVGALNATALFLCLIGPMLWLLHQRLVTREITWCDVWAFGWRTATLTLATTLWWIVGLMVEGKYGVNLLRFTETLETVATTAFPVEFLRGLGFWFFYGRDTVGLWNDGMIDFTRSVVILAGLFLVALAFLAAGAVRWRHRVFFVALIFVGLTISVGAAPYNDPSLFGRLWKSFALDSQTGMALRNSGRAVPLIALGLAALLAAGVSSLVMWLQRTDRRTLAIRVVAGIGALCVINAAGSWGGRYYSHYLERDEDIPTYWKQAIAALESESHDTRVLAEPGSDYATYRWGDTRDPIEPGLMDRPYVAREIVPWGTPASINLMRAIDVPLQQGLLDPSAVAPLARLMSVGDVLLRMDLATDRWTLVSAGTLWKMFTATQVKGLSPPQTYGTRIPGKLRFPDLGDFSIPESSEPEPPPIAVFPVNDPLPIARTKSADAPLVIDGDGVGLVDVAAVGLLDAQRTVLYAGSHQNDPSFIKALPNDAPLVVTDSNRKRGERWSRMFNNYGYTEQAGETPLVENPLDQRLEIFPGTNDDARTVTDMRGVKSVQATTYGDRILGFTPLQRPSRVLDGDTETGWEIDAGFPVRNERLRIELAKPITTDHVNLVQILRDNQKRWITDVGLRFDGGPMQRAKLDASSRKEAGQTLSFPRRSFSTLEIDITGVRDPSSLYRATRNAVGFSEVRVTDDVSGAPVRVDEAARLPNDLLGALGAQSMSHPLAIVLSPDVMDDASMKRVFTLPKARSFNLSGSAVVSPKATDDSIDRRLGLADATNDGVTVTAKHPFGKPAARASSALDGDPRTAWNSPLGSKPPKEFVRVAVPHPVTFDHLDLALVEDNRHSIPLQIEVTSGAERRVVDIPPSGPPDANGVVRQRVRFAPITGDDFKFVVTKYKQVIRNDGPMPVGIAELGIPGVRRAAEPSEVASSCITDLVRIDGKPFPVRVSGSTRDAEAQRPIELLPCNRDATVSLGAGRHEIDVAMNPDTHGAMDVSHLVLASAPGGAATSPAALSSTSAEAAPPMRVIKHGRASMTVEVDPTAKPFWFVLGESNNRGWSAHADGVDLGSPELVDGYANGWQVVPRSANKPITITLAWTPQRTVWRSMLVSAAAGIVSVGIVLVGLARRRRRRREPPDRRSAPELRVPLVERAGVVRASSVWVAVVVAGGLAAAVVRPWAGLLVGFVTYLAARNDRWRLGLRFAPAVILVCVGVGVAAAQVVRRYPLRFEWPTFFDWARYPVWIAVTLLLAEAVLGAFVDSRDRAPNAVDSPKIE
jgi:arabinofuranan 3-O-arabinosyltransferase